MGKILMFGDIEIEKDNFYRNKSTVFLEDVDIEKVLVPNKISFGEKKTISALLVSMRFNHTMIFFKLTN